MRDGLVQRVLDDADVRDLAAEMEVEQLEAVGHAAPLQLVEPLKDLGDGQAELRPVAGRSLPASAAARGQLHAHPDVRPDADLLRVLEDQVQLGELLDDRDDVAAHLLGEHHGLDVLGVLEAVAHDRRVVGRQRDHGEQLGLAAGFETELVRRAEVEDFLDDLALLVDLDRIHAAVAAVVLVLGDRRLEGVVDVGQPVLEDVAEANEERDRDAACLQVVDELLEVDGARRIFRGVNLDVPAGVDREVAFAPTRHFIELVGVGDAPSFTGRHRLTQATTRCAHAHA